MPKKKNETINSSESTSKKIESVAAYIRVSTTEQKLHGISLDAQRMKLKEYAESHNMKIVDWYEDEGVSGRKLIRKRPELQRMIQDAEQKKFEKIIFIKLDRFFRSVAEYHECMKRISPVLWEATEEEYNLTTANGRMLVNMKLTIAELEADQTGERIRIVNEYKTSNGQPLTGTMPFGFKIAIDDKTGRKKIIKNPEQQEALEDLLEYIFAYNSKRKALMYLKTKYNVVMPYKSLTTLLRNTMLCGEYRGNKKYCEAYLSREEFDKLQEIANKNNIKCNTEKKEYVFSGLIKCPVCGCKLSGNTTKCRIPSGREYWYKKYRCLNYFNNNTCEFNKCVSENALERELLNIFEDYVESVKSNLNDVENSDFANIPQYNEEEINEQIDRLNYSWQTGKIRKVEQYESQYEELIKKLELAREEKKKVVIPDFSKAESIFKTGWKDIYAQLGEENKRAFWRSLISSIEINWTTEIKEIKKINFF